MKSRRGWCLPVRELPLRSTPAAASFGEAAFLAWYIMTVLALLGLFESRLEAWKGFVVSRCGYKAGSSASVFPRNTLRLHHIVGLER